MKILVLVLLLGIALKIGYKAFFSLLRNRVVVAGEKPKTNEIKVSKGE